MPDPAQISLPIDAVVPELVAASGQARCLVVEAPPGAGKTTRVPIVLLEHQDPGAGEIWVLQPRRIAARMAARRVAALLGEPVGRRCGYQVRFESKVSEHTQIRFMTEGLLLTRLLDNPELRGVGTVVFDEFHERHLDGDLALMLLRRLQQTSRPELRLVVMSATLDAQHVSAYFLPEVCPRIRSEGRTFPVDITYTAGARERERSLESRVLRAFHDIVDTGLDGHVLVFLPGAREIAACAEACAGLARHHGLEIHRLHGEMPPQAQDEAVENRGVYKLILSTNVAETSITIDGVVAVIDSGLHRQASHDPWSGLPVLALRPISQASATQRAGRAGRTRPGRCIRLYSQNDFNRRPAFDRPEVLRADLAGAILRLSGGDGPMTGLRWLDEPSAASLAHARELLVAIGALDSEGALTAVGSQMRRLPLHPRLARVVVAGAEHGIVSMAATAVALLSERSIYPPHVRKKSARREAACDLLNEIDDLRAAQRGHHGAVVPDACARVRRVARALVKSANTCIPHVGKPPPRGQRDQALCLSLLTAYPDRVAEVRRDERGDRTVAFCQGGHAKLGPSCAVGDVPIVVALTVEQRRGTGQGKAVVTRAAIVEPEWLLDLFAEQISDHTNLSFDSQRERVEGVSELRFGNVTLDRSRLQSLPPEAAEVLAKAVFDYGVDRFVEPAGAITQLRRRLALIAEHAPDAVQGLVLGEDSGSGLSSLSERLNAVVEQTILALCHNCTSFAELRRADVLAHVLGQFDQARLQRLCPTHIALPGRRRVPVHYEEDRPAWIESRLQDFFGLEQGPTILGGRISLVLHLLAPNRRAVQVTTDLVGFWQRHYPEQRRALMRRYPRHSWPDDPLTAKPPEPRKRRR